MLNFFTKEGFQNVYHNTTKHLSLLVIAILIGVTLGFKLSIWYLDYRINESIKLQGFIHQGIVYDIKLRP